MPRFIPEFVPCGMISDLPPSSCACRKHQPFSAFYLLGFWVLGT